ncbi:MAG: DUF805 domain-containing protein [Alphaproteobacteria bacterium]|nr:DUF805 domain-containing protein [Alphaproteobacteria bacterium]
MDTLLNPMGRISPTAFRNAAMILITLGACLSLLPLALPALALWSFASLLLLYPWAVIWVKRFHDACKSGKWFLAVFAAWLTVGSTASYFISAKFAPAMPAKPNPAEIWRLMAARMQAVALPGTVASVTIALAFALIINEELKSDPAENAYGAACR